MIIQKANDYIYLNPPTYRGFILYTPPYIQGFYSIHTPIYTDFMTPTGLEPVTN